MNDSFNIEVLPSNRLLDEREHESLHTPYELETAFYSSIARGNTEEMKAMLERLMKDKVYVGRLSFNSLKQVQYWAVCCVAIATRYAIIGGLNETTAYNFSDECILKIDSMREEKQIVAFLTEKSFELTEMVNEAKNGEKYPRYVRICLREINQYLFSDLSADFLAKQCGVSKDHLCMLFKKATGMTIAKYIKTERLKAAKELLEGGMSVSATAYTVGFCSESYFIKCFKDYYGVTPKKIS